MILFFGVYLIFDTQGMSKTFKLWKIIKGYLVVTFKQVSIELMSHQLHRHSINMNLQIGI